MITENKGLQGIKMPKVAPVIKEVEGDWCQNSKLYIEAYTPLAERMTSERPDLVAPLDKLKLKLGKEQYERLISPLTNITKQGESLMIIAKNHLQRSLIERDCVPALKEAFEVSRLRIVV